MTDEISPQTAGRGTYLADRAALLDVRPHALGLEPLDLPSGLWGVAFEVGLAHDGVVTLVTYADGTTSLLASSGSVLSGAGAHEPVRLAARALMDAVPPALEHLAPDPERRLPEVDTVTVRAMTDVGERAGNVHLDAAVRGDHPLSPAFLAGHGTIAIVGEIAARLPGSS